MKTTKEFIDALVSIDKMQDENFGHYPFRLAAVNQDDKLIINSLALNAGVFSYYSVARKFVKENSKRIFLSMDFPAGADMKDDFIAVFSVINGKTEVVAIPYSPETGTRFPLVKSESSILLTQIKNQFESAVFPS